MKKFLLCQRGVTLVENMMALAILGIFLVCMLEVVMGVNRIKGLAHNQMIATNIAESYMEDSKFSHDITIGETIEKHDDFIIKINITEIGGYQNEESDLTLNLYKIVIEVEKKGEKIEEVTGYRSSIY